MVSTVGLAREPASAVESAWLQVGFTSRRMADPEGNEFDMLRALGPNEIAAG